MRVLGRVRLSRVMEESTSVERQRGLIENWSKQHGHEVIGWATDLDVSGSVDPFDTPGLGQWLTEERSQDWDTVCTWKLDRLGRDAIRLNKLFGWCIDHGKTVVSTSEGIDLSTPVGRLIANVIAFLAEGELAAIRERTAASQRRLRELGRWGGGKPYYGYQAVQRDGGAGWRLVPDGWASGILLKIIDLVLDGKSTQSIAQELNEIGELSPSDYLRKRAGKPVRGSQWSNAHIRQQLRSKTLLGYMTHNGDTIRDDLGQPVQKGEALVSRDTFDRLQAALDSKSFKVTNRSAKASPMLGVASCLLCGRLMHLRQHHKKDRGKTYRYYQCNGGATGHVREHEPNIIKADELESLVEQTFLEELGADNVRERVFIPAESHQIELEEAMRAVEEITTLAGTMTSTTVRLRLTEQLRALDLRVLQLESLPTSESRWEYRETDETYSDAWDNADTEGKRQLLLKSGITASVWLQGRTRQTPGALHFELRIPEDVRERLSM